MDTTYQTTDKANGKKPEATAPKKQHTWLNGIPEISAYTGCSRRTIQNWISNGYLPVKRLSSRHILATRENVNELIDRLDAEYRAKIGE